MSLVGVIGEIREFSEELKQQSPVAFGLCAAQRRTEGFAASLWLEEAGCPGDRKVWGGNQLNREGQQCELVGRRPDSEMGLGWPMVQGESCLKPPPPRGRR